MNEREYYLQAGKFTGIDDTVLRALEQVQGLEDRKTLPGKISLYLTDILRPRIPRKMEEFRKRTASEIIYSGYCQGCTDRGIVFATLARASGIPTKYIETFNRDSLTKRSIKIRGHIFAEIFSNGIWIPYEPKWGLMEKEGYWLGKNKYIKIGEGLDFSELKLENGNVINLYSIKKIRDIRKILSWN